MTVSKLVASPRSGVVLLFAVVFVLAGCTSDNSGSDEPNSPTSAATGSGPSQQSGDDQAAATPRLGFESAVFRIPPPVDVAEDAPPFDDAVSLIDAGVEAGVWTEADGVRAVLSIVVGELAPEAVPAFDQLPHSSHREIFERARLLLEDPTVDDAARADLARLTDFFFSDTYAAAPSTSEESSTGTRSSGEQGIILASARGSVEQTSGCSPGTNQVFEMEIFEAADTSVCYRLITNAAGDAIFLPIAPDTVDASDLIFEIIEKARTGYAELAGSELPEIRLLLSTRESPPDKEDPKGGGSISHVLSSFASTCRVAVFATDTFFEGGPDLRFAIAHEMFHCIQYTWPGDIADDLTDEGGADYFAYRLLDECVASQTALGQVLDTQTANGSLLDVDYAGWFFWAFLDERGYLSAQEISQLHLAISEGTSVSAGLSALVSDLPSMLNEFYVRLMGPGLACDFQGKEVTDTKPVKEKGPIELDASLWQGTRYKLDYTKKRLFEQENKGPGRIGMAKFASRSAEDDWVVTTPEVRTKCTEDEPWIVVVTALIDSETAPPQVLEVTEMGDGVCDACLIGQWGIDPESVNAVFAKNIPGQAVDVTGSWILEFAAAVDGATSATFTDERDLQLAGGPLVIDMRGGGSGAYRADETKLVVDGYTSTVVASALGFTSVPFGFAGDGDSVAYICEKDSLTYTIGSDEWAATRIPETPKGEPYFG